MKVEFKQTLDSGKQVSVVAIVSVNPNRPYKLDNMPFVVKSLIVDGRDLEDSDEDEDCDLADSIVYNPLINAVIYNQLAA